MSAFAIPALGLAGRAAATLPGLFADLMQRAPAPDIAMLVSCGHGAPGQGAGTYVEDPRCDRALADAHPRFVFRTANGRTFRLLPEAGSLSVEQGGAAGDGETDDREAIQAAIDYAGAIGARELRFENPRYRVDCPIRLSPAGATRARDGHPLVVRHTLSMSGCAATPSVLDFRGPNGGEPGEDYQLVATSAADPALAVWRGGGMFVDGDPADNGEGRMRIERLELSRLHLSGNRTRSGSHAWPADPLTGAGWDITDKAFWLQDCHVGDVVMRDVAMTGWRGEIFYLGGPGNAVRSLRLENCRFAGTDGTAFNPGVNVPITARDCSFGDAFQAQEDAGKARAHYRDCLWHDCAISGFGGGPTAGLLYNFAYPTRDEGSDLPLTTIESGSFRNAGEVHIASWVAGAIRTIDTQVVVDTAFSHAPRDAELSIEAWLDKADAIAPLTIHGPATLTEQVPGAPPGVYREAPRDMRFRVSHRRTALARREDRHWRAPWWSGHVAKTCRIVCDGTYDSGHAPHGEADPVSMPFVDMAGSAPSRAFVPHGAFTLPAFTGPAQFAPPGPLVALEVAGQIQVDLTVLGTPSGGAVHGYSHGQRLRLVKLLDTGAIRFVKNSAPWYFEMVATRVLDRAYDWIDFVYNGDLARWEEAGFFSSS